MSDNWYAVNQWTDDPRNDNARVMMATHYEHYATAREEYDNWEPVSHKAKYVELSGPGIRVLRRSKNYRPNMLDFLRCRLALLAVF